MRNIIGGHRCTLVLLLCGGIVLCAGCDRKEAVPEEEGAFDPSDWEDSAAGRVGPGSSLFDPPPAGGEHASDRELDGVQFSDQLMTFAPLRDARAGEWARYAAMDGRELRWEVVGVDGEEVRVEVRAFADGKPVGLPATRTEPIDFDPVGARGDPAAMTRRQGEQTIRVAGRAWEARLYEDRWVDEETRYVRRTWVSDAVPVFGMVRMTLTGDGEAEAELELRAWGKEVR